MGRGLRATQTWLWLAGFALWTIGFGAALHVAGAESPTAPGLSAVMLAGVLAGSAALGGCVSRTAALGLLAASAVVVSTILVSLVGPDSGASGACSAGEDCGTDQGLGYVIGPVFLGLPMGATFLVGWLAASVIHRLRTHFGSASKRGKVVHRKQVSS
jgi:hypothetical protein